MAAGNYAFIRGHGPPAALKYREPSPNLLIPAAIIPYTGSIQPGSASMADHREPDPQLPPRRFVYRSAEADAAAPHPLRRSTDFPRPFQCLPGHIEPKAQLLKFRVYLKVN